MKIQEDICGCTIPLYNGEFPGCTNVTCIDSKEIKSMCTQGVPLKLKIMNV
jgi:hypothetical protein